MLKSTSLLMCDQTNYIYLKYCNESIQNLLYNIYELFTTREMPSEKYYLFIYFW